MKITIAIVLALAPSVRAQASPAASVPGAGNLAIPNFLGEAGERLAAAHKSILNATGINIHGLLDLGVNYNFNQPATGNNLYRAFDYFGASNFEPNQGELYVARQVAHQPGFVIDLNFLNTAEILHGVTSYYQDQPGPWNPTGWMDPTQAYLTYTIPLGKGINLSAGRQPVLVGKEVIPTWNNLNYNQSVGLLFVLGEPFTVTGLRANYVFDPHAAATVGLNNGWDTIANRNMFQTIEGQLALTPFEQLSWNIQGMFGPSSGTQAGSKRFIADTTATWKPPVRRLTLSFEYLYGHQSGPVVAGPLTVEAPNYAPNPLLSRPGAPGPVTINHGVEWQGAAVWIAYNLTASLVAATRGEWFDDSSGARTGIGQTLADITETFTWRIPRVNNLVARLEYRHDFSSQNPFPNSGPFVTFACPAGNCVSTAHTYSGQDTLEAAAIYTW